MLYLDLNLIKKECIVYFHSFLPVNSQTTTKITAITSSICINAPTPGKAKNPTAQSNTIIIAIVNHVFIANSPTKSPLLVSGTCEAALLRPLGLVPYRSSVQLLSPRLKWPTCFVLRLSLRQALIQLHPWSIRFQDELLSNLPDLFLIL